MPSASKLPPSLTPQVESPVLEAGDVLEAMIDLRIQEDDLKRQIKALQPAFFAACAALGTNKIVLERAMITRRLTRGKWDYAPDILEQEALLEQLRQEFQKLYEPTSGREVSWVIQLLLDRG